MSVIGTFYYVRFIKEVYFIVPFRWVRLEVCEDAPYRGCLPSFSSSFNAVCCALSCCILSLFALYPIGLLQLLHVFSLLF